MDATEGDETRIKDLEHDVGTFIDALEQAQDELHAAQVTAQYWRARCLAYMQDKEDYRHRALSLSTTDGV